MSWQQAFNGDESTPTGWQWIDDGQGDPNRPGYNSTIAPSDFVSRFGGREMTPDELAAYGTKGTGANMFQSGYTPPPGMTVYAGSPGIPLDKPILLPLSSPLVQQTSSGGGLGGFVDALKNDFAPGGLPLLLAAAGGGAMGGAFSGMGALETQAAQGLAGAGELSNVPALTSGAASAGGASVGAGTGALSGGGSSAGGGMEWFDDHTNFEPQNFSGGTSNDFFSPDFSAPAGGTGALDTSGLNAADWQTTNGWSTNPSTADLGGNIDPSTGFPIGTDPSIVDKLKQYGAQGWSLLQKAIGGDGSAISTLGRLGIGAAAIAGIAEKNRNPLAGPMTDAARGALSKANVFAGMPSIPTTPSEARAITVANSNVGAWKPYTDAAGALTTAGTGGVTPETLARYQDPYIKGVLDPQLLQISRDAAAKRLQQNAAAGMHGAFGGDQADIQSGIIDRNEMEARSQATGTAYSNAFNTALTAGQNDLNRDLTGATSDTNVAKTVGALGATDVAGLKDAGTLEREPLVDARNMVSDSSKLFTGAISGSGNAIATAARPSTLQNATGALGALQSAKNIGLL